MGVIEVGAYWLAGVQMIVVAARVSVSRKLPWELTWMRGGLASERTNERTVCRYQKSMEIVTKKSEESDEEVRGQ